MNKQKQTLVSVVMPVYNAGEFLVEAIQSIINQTYSNFELIIVDDHSTDNSWKIIRQFKRRYPQLIKAVRLKTNLNKGGDACANVGYRMSKGEFIARMDADDIAYPQRLAEQVEYMNDHPDVLLLGSQAEVINRRGQIIGKKTVPQTHRKIYSAYFVFHPIIHPTVMIRKSLLPKRKNLYKIRYSANNDLYTFFQLLEKGRFANLPQKLLYYRMHGHNDSLTKPKERFYNTLKIRLNAVRHGFRPTPKAVITTIIQTMVISVIPSSIIVPLYLYAKGIRKLPKLSIRYFGYKLHPVFNFSRIRQYLLSLL